MPRSKEIVTVVVVKIPFAILRALMATFNEARALLRPNGCGGSPVIVETRGGVETMQYAGCGESRKSQPPGTGGDFVMTLV